MVLFGSTCKKAILSNFLIFDFWFGFWFGISSLAHCPQVPHNTKCKNDAGDRHSILCIVSHALLSSSWSVHIFLRILLYAYCFNHIDQWRMFYAAQYYVFCWTFFCISVCVYSLYLILCISLYFILIWLNYFIHYAILHFVLYTSASAYYCIHSILSVLFYILLFSRRCM